MIVNLVGRAVPKTCTEVTVGYPIRTHLVLLVGLSVPTTFKEDVAAAPAALLAALLVLGAVAAGGPRMAQAAELEAQAEAADPRTWIFFRTRLAPVVAIISTATTESRSSSVRCLT